jgi:3-phenylpropionate/trans-cinnamate dioxygenase ferredoxin subunit
VTDQQPIDLFAAADLADGDMKTIPAKSTGWSDAITVFRDGEDFFALDDTCPHEKASLADGWLEDGEIECPLHQSRFNLKTGAVTCLPATRNARPHRVEVIGGRVWLTPGQSPTDAG